MPRISKALQQAIDSLTLHDIYLSRSQSSFAEDFEPKYSNELDNLSIQRLHLVLENTVLEVAEEQQILRIIIRLGTRWVSDENEQEPTVKAYIEADFTAEYLLHQELSQKSIDEFALKNVSYHIWPYWREYLASQTERMRLPSVILPMVQFAQQKQE